MAASGLCQPRTASSFSVSSYFSVYSVLRFFGGKTKVKSFNTEDTEKSEGTEKSSLHWVIRTGEQNFLVRSGLSIVGIGRMKLNAVARARMRNIFTGKGLIER
jgi:hypothetical protein